VIVYESGYHYKITDFLTLIGGMTMSRGNTRSLLLGGLVEFVFSPINILFARVSHGDCDGATTM
jgi:hypothetical protein